MNLDLHAGIRIEPYDENNYEKVDEYELSPFIRVVIARDRRTNALKYFAIEEPLTEEEQRTLERIISILRFLLLKHEGEDVDYILKNRLGVTSEKLLYYIKRDFMGYGPLTPLILDPNLEDISCNGVGIPIYVWHRKYESLETNITFTDVETLKSYIRSLVARCGKHISAAFPMVDATLPDTGYRLAATLEDISGHGPTFTIRKFRERPFTVTELIADGVLDSLTAAFFWVMIENNRTVMIYGSTGAGKTTLLNALLTFVPPNEKICSVEETREINIPSKNWVAFVTRESYAIGEQVSNVTLYDLLKVCLRYRPRTIVVGEIRGAEAYVLFQAMQSGHGGLSTIHADSIESMINRLLNPPMNVPRELIPSLNFAIGISRVKIKGRIARRVRMVHEIHGVDDYLLLVEWDAVNDEFIHYMEKSEILELVARQLGLSKEELWCEIERRAKLLDYMVDNRIFEYDRIVSIVFEYYTDPERVLRRISGSALAKKEAKQVAEIRKRLESLRERTAPSRPAAGQARVDVSRIRDEILSRFRTLQRRKG